MTKWKKTTNLSKEYSSCLNQTVVNLASYLEQNRCSLILSASRLNTNLTYLLPFPSSPSRGTNCQME